MKLNKNRINSYLEIVPRKLERKLLLISRKKIKAREIIIMRQSLILRK